MFNCHKRKRGRTVRMRPPSPPPSPALVTGNARHYRPIAGEHGVPVLGPAELLERLAERG
jgi:hypothetical protein